MVDTYLTFLSYIPIPTQLILMKVTHRDRILLVSRAPNFMIQAMVKIEKLAPLLTHFYYILQILNRMAKIKTLRPLQTYITMIVPNKHPSHARILKLHLNLCNNHHHGRVTTLQRMRSTILKPKLDRKMSLVNLEAVNTTYALIPILSTSENTEFHVCKFSFQPLFVCHSYSSVRFFCTHSFSFVGANSYKNIISTKDTIQYQTKTNKVY